MQQFLIIYVYDMKLAGPKHLMEQAWEKLGEGISLEKPKGNEEGTGNETLTFWGCEQKLVEEEIVMPNGKTRKVRGMTWDVSHSMSAKRQ